MDPSQFALKMFLAGMVFTVIYFLALNVSVANVKKRKPKAWPVITFIFAGIFAVALGTTSLIRLADLLNAWGMYVLMAVHIGTIVGPAILALWQFDRYVPKVED